MYKLMIIWILMTFSDKAQARDTIKPSKIKEFQFSTKIDFKSDVIAFDLPIFNIEGNKDYVLKCRGGHQDKFLNLIADNFDYLSPLHCNLQYKNYKINLLAHDATRAGMFDHARFLPQCVDYPQFGKKQVFKLRGLRIVFSFSSIKLSKPRLEYDEWRPHVVDTMTMTVNVMNDPSSKTTIAEHPGFEHPKKNCKMIRKRKNLCNVETRKLLSGQIAQGDMNICH